MSNPIGILAGVALLGLCSLTFFVIGKFAKPIAWGVLATLAMPVGLFFFAGAVTFMGLALKLWSWESVLMNFALLGGTALIFSLIGKFGKEKILIGALGVAAMGVSLIAFSLGIAAYGLSLKLYDWETIAKSLAVLGGIATVFTLIGQFGKTGFVGAAIVAAAGASLILFGVGVNLYGRSLS